MDPERVRLTLDLTGVVQGVGFRPAVKRLADKRGLSGWVQNRSGTVRLAVEGPASEIQLFVQELPLNLPPSARLDSVTEVDRSPATGHDGFRILDSGTDPVRRVMIPADLAVCPECLSEVTDPSDRRFGYPFTTCTRCGPRYTVVDSMPYDRERTTLSVFPLCPDCRREYEDPADRRFHAESIACPACGPRLFLADMKGDPVPGDPLTVARSALAGGKIVAVRSIGGFQLAADALNREAVERLRERKRRPHKPFAVMARDMEVVRRYCRADDAVSTLMAGPVAPIVICDLLPDVGNLPSDALSPDTSTLGVMRVTSPLHQLLFHPLPGDRTPAFDLLVMTSGNRGGEPICISNAQAFERLSPVADLVLGHDREINLRNDDSVCVVGMDGTTQVWRRARGYSPEPVRLSRPLRRTVLALGAELKNTVAVASGVDVTLSPHIGDLETPEALDFLRETVERLPGFVSVEPEVIACDLHPDMRSTRLGVELSARLGVPRMSVQHHHAHAAACMAEHGLDEALALVFDGTGLGTDGTVWGAELLHVTPDGFRRLASFAPVPLPGGDAAVLEPARQLVARLVGAGLGVGPEVANVIAATDQEMEVWALQCRKRVNAPLTHAAGRLFDAFSCAVGLAPRRITYEAQAAIRLEACARTYDGSERLPEVPYRLAEDPSGVAMVDWSETFRVLVERTPVEDGSRWARAFHEAVAQAALDMARYGRDRTAQTAVALAGGVFMNRLLVSILEPLLRGDGFEVFAHHVVPPNDGSLSLGQAVVAGRSG